MVRPAQLQQPSSPSSLGRNTSPLKRPSASEQLLDSSEDHRALASTNFAAVTTSSPMSKQLAQEVDDLTVAFMSLSQMALEAEAQEYFGFFSDGAANLLRDQDRVRIEDLRSAQAQLALSLQTISLQLSNGSISAAELASGGQEAGLADVIALAKRRLQQGQGASPLALQQLNTLLKENGAAELQTIPERGWLSEIVSMPEQAAAELSQDSMLSVSLEQALTVAEARSKSSADAFVAAKEARLQTALAQYDGKAGPRNAHSLLGALVVAAQLPLLHSLGSYPKDSPELAKQLSSQKVVHQQEQDGQVNIYRLLSFEETLAAYRSMRKAGELDYLDIGLLVQLDAIFEIDS